MASQVSDARPAPDALLTDIADYVNGCEIRSGEAYRVARYCVMDAIGCALEALQFPECLKLLGPIVPGLAFRDGARVPGTRFELDPISAAFSIGTMIRWLDYNDSFTAAEGGHPSDNIGGILATADYLSRQRIAEGDKPLLMRDVLIALIEAYEIQGVLSLENNFTRLGLDHVTFTRVAAAAVLTKMLGGGRDEIVNAVSNAWADGASLKIYRQGNNTGTRKNWAGGDASSRALRLALMAMQGEMGYPSVLSAKTFGFCDAIFRGQPIKLQRPYSTYVVEHVLFKFVAAGMHGQTAAECAFRLHPLVKDRLDAIETITIRSHEKLMGIMDKQGPLTNPADRDHCVQYVVAVGLLHGRLDPADFEDEFAADPRIDRLRAKMKVAEEPRYTRDFFDPEKRSSANSIEVRFADRSQPATFEVEYPIGHPRRRAEGLPMLEAKFTKHVARRFPRGRQLAILELFEDQALFEAKPVNEFLQYFVI
ncbi:MAG: bifunctional 2-methylcitrate dehydratase/aconitate hydratase [Betaproteobacteria bacterium]|nr:bifunctional 2-methylcitrate dehydratase/aconitate hydratase [Betaproteobacteria bacterium]